MTEKKYETPAIVLKPGWALPPGSDVIQTLPDGRIVVERPIKFLPVWGVDEAGRRKIVDWERRPREDFI